MPERILILALVVVALGAAVLMARLWSRRRAARVKLRASNELWDALGTRPDGRTTVVAFSSPSCAACHTAQRPALRVLETTLGEDSVRILDIDTASQPLVAKTFGILTVPSTVVLRRDGAVLAVNNGFTPASRLATQASAA